MVTEKYLCWRWEEYNNKENKDKVIVQIRNIKYDEWIKQIDNYLWLVSKVKIYSINKYTLW